MKRGDHVFLTTKMYIPPSGVTTAIIATPLPTKCGIAIAGQCFGEGCVCGPVPSYNRL